MDYSLQKRNKKELQVKKDDDVRFHQLKAPQGFFPDGHLILWPIVLQ